MTSASAAQLPSPDSRGGVFSLTEPTMCVVQLAHQRPGVVHQVVLDPAKVKDGLIRLGEWPGDEANGWQMTGSVTVLAVLGRAERTDTGMRVTPIKSLEDELLAIRNRAIWRGMKLIPFDEIGDAE